MAPLTLLLLLPLAGALALALLPSRVSRAALLATSLGGLALALSLTAGFDPTDTGFQWVDEARWIPAIGVGWRVGVDAIGLPFLLATELIFAAVLLFERGPRERERGALLLLLKAATLGIFVALDGVLFFLCWELTLLPIYVLVARHGHGQRAADAALQYVLTMLLAGLPVLIAFVIRGTFGGALDFDLRHWLAVAPDPATQRLIFLLLFVGFAFKVPLFPFHTWLPTLAREGGAGTLATLVGLKVGAYALLRLAIPLAPDAAAQLHWLIAAGGAAALLFGAIAALAQTNLRGLLAYASVSHVGLVVLGLASLSADAARGATLQLINFALISTPLFLLAGAIQRRHGTCEVHQLGGLAGHQPRLSALFIFFALASLGLPGTSGFPAELTLLLSVFEQHAGAALTALLAAGLGAAALLGHVRRAFFGPPPASAYGGKSDDLTGAELAVVLLFAALVLVIGFFPGPLFDFFGPAAQAWAVR
jgi:NADH-quinone oxidoreductase subunit M